MAAYGLPETACPTKTPGVPETACPTKTAGVPETACPTKARAAERGRRPRRETGNAATRIDRGDRADRSAPNRLLFAFQPVVCAASGEVDYFECLLRMRTGRWRPGRLRRVYRGGRAQRPDRHDRPLRPGAGAGRNRRPSEGEARLQRVGADRRRPALAALADVAVAPPAGPRAPPGRRDHRDRGARRHRGNRRALSIRCGMPAAASRSTISAPATLRCAICRCSAVDTGQDRRQLRPQSRGTAARTGSFCAICSV